MLVGIPRESKSREDRVATIPAGVVAPVRRGHEVLAEPAASGRIVAADADRTPGSVLVESRPTCRAHGSSSCRAANTPGVVPRTSAWALSLADKGFRRAVLGDPVPANGINAVRGSVADL